MQTATIEPKEVLQKITDTFDELKKGIQPEKLTAADKKAVLKELDKLEELALSIKRKISK